MAYFGDNAVHAWGVADSAGNLAAGYNIDDVDDNGTGDCTFDFITATGTSDYCVVQSIKVTGGNPEMVSKVQETNTAYVRLRNGYTYYSAMGWYDWGGDCYNFASLDLY